jgi:D-tagatose-1,6-bisphosphate aldolase subunit GatZ/KbaZ
MTISLLLDLPRQHRIGIRAGITSICSAHPLVIEAALLRGRDENRAVLIEATCNQVNQDGGYTGMTPADFRRFVEAIAARIGFDTDQLILGGDHLGPNPWKHLPAAEALDKAKVMIDGFVKAGFTKLHLDTSMGCLGEPIALPDAITADRAAQLAKTAEAVSDGRKKPVYIIGTEVPVPGGALEALDHLEVTSPAAALDTIAVHRAAFAAFGLEDAFERDVGIVVQPGVEFGNEDVIVYRPEAAEELSAVLRLVPQFVFEAHSTDYQPETALSALVRDGFNILKVGPGLTFALREALYGLDQIAVVLDDLPPSETLRAGMEALMMREPKYWSRYYHGSDADLKVQRHFSYSDRIRYYWPHPDALALVEKLMARFGDKPLPAPLISQYLAALYPAAAEGTLQADARSLLIGAVQRQIDLYQRAIRK